MDSANSKDTLEPKGELVLKVLRLGQTCGTVWSVMSHAKTLKKKALEAETVIRLLSTEWEMQLNTSRVSSGAVICFAFFLFDRCSDSSLGWV